VRPNAGELIVALSVRIIIKLWSRRARAAVKCCANGSRSLSSSQSIINKAAADPKANISRATAALIDRWLVVVLFGGARRPTVTAIYLRRIMCGFDFGYQVGLLPLMELLEVL
jgi:hypothetical protein